MSLVCWPHSWRRILTRDLQLTLNIIRPKFNNFLRTLLFILLFLWKANGWLSHRLNHSVLYHHHSTHTYTHRTLAELIRQLDDEGSQEMALSLLESNHQGGLDMFPPSDPQSPDIFQLNGRHAGGQWDPWSSPSAGLGPPKQPPSSANMQRIRRSNSLTPPSNSMGYPQDPWGNQVT